MSRGADPDRPRSAIPDGFARRMRAWLGDDEAEALLDALDRPAERGLRVQHDRIRADDLAAKVDWRLEPVPWSPHGFLVDAAGEAPGAHVLHEAGAYYLQDPSAMAPAAALEVRPGERVIDLAAAPGGKASAFVADLAADRGDDGPEPGARPEPEGVLVANDVHPKRVAALARNLERVGARSAIVTQLAPDDWAQIAPESFDAVLLDAPCSGEGMFRKSEAARADWSQATVDACAGRQDRLLEAAARLLAPGGRLVYATCTFALEENERVIAALLERRPDLTARPLRLEGTSPGYPVDGRPASSDAGSAPRLPANAVARLWPHLVHGDGHVVTMVVRDADASRQARARAASGSIASAARGRGTRGEISAPPSRELRAAWRAFAEATLHSAARDALERDEPDDEAAARARAHADDVGGRLVQRGGVLWRRAGPATWSAVPSLRPGLALGRLQGDRFVPAHALAQALRPGEARVRLDLPLASASSDAWLAGEELEWQATLAAGAVVTGDAAELGRGGYVQVTVAGCGLGWARRSGDRLRNLYPKGLRRRR